MLRVSGCGYFRDRRRGHARPLRCQAGGEWICTIESPDLASTVEAYVSVMRIRRIGHQHLVGLRFESISDEQLQIIHAYETLIKARNARRAPE